mmetsp:Transcript_104033/g.303703  ORF Transcript_104033/g.303703 Transcript_104033/m.303703 type:complete len:244 (+) Transcript_104033:743-1474(+)
MSRVPLCFQQSFQAPSVPLDVTLTDAVRCGIFLLFLRLRRLHHLARHLHDFLFSSSSLPLRCRDDGQVPLGWPDLDISECPDVDDELADLLLCRRVRAGLLQRLVQDGERLLPTVGRRQRGGPPDPGLEVPGQQAAGLAGVVDRPLVGVEPEEGQGAVGVDQGAEGVQRLGAALREGLASGKGAQLVAVHGRGPVHLQEVHHCMGVSQRLAVLPYGMSVLHLRHRCVALLLAPHGIVLHGLQN